MLSTIMTIPVAPPGTVDAGESYSIAPGQRLPLFRATDQVMVGLFPTSAARRRRLIAALTADGGALQGYSQLQALDSHTFLFQRSSRLANPGYRRLSRRIAGFPALKYFAPTFFNGVDVPRLAVTDHIHIDLRDDVDATTFLGTAYTDVQISVGINAYDMQMADSGGLAVLKRAAELEDNPLVESVDPIGATAFV